MEFLLLSAFLAAAVTAATAWALVRRHPAGSVRSQWTIAALSFPALSVLVFLLATVVALVDGSQVREPGGTTGMVIFALAFFLAYALCVGAIVGVPVAFLTVRWLRASA